MATVYRLRERVHAELIPDLLHTRGVLSEEDVGKFLAPDFIRDSHDPFLLPDMGKAVERVLFARSSGEKVAVWSDYDCDGIPGGVLLTEFLRAVGLSVRHYIPHRHAEGYGMNETGIQTLVEEGVTLIVTVDLGTTEHGPIAFAKEKGIDVIVTDHHVVLSAPEESLPQRSSDLPRSSSDELRARPFVSDFLLVPILPKDAFAVINPKRPDSTYPFDGLCGAGVAWKLVQGILLKLRIGGTFSEYPEGREKWLLDLVGMATLSDMVPLIDENRMLARCGLIVMRKARRPGLAALLSLLRISPPSITEDDIGFMIAPRINAASRMGSPESAALLLRSETLEEAKGHARVLNSINDERKSAVAVTVKEVNKRLEASGLSESPVIVMGSTGWRPGILGLVANSLMQKHGKPVFLWGREGGELLRGSCRSSGEVSVVDLMHGAVDVFDHCGGHAASGGFSLDEGRAHELLPRLVASYQALMGTAAQVVKEVVVDRELDLAETSRAHRELKQLAPFGVQNEKPLFLFPNIDIGPVRTFGKNTDHLDIKLGKSGMQVPGIAFFSTPESFQKTPTVGTKADIVGHVETDWRGGPRIRVVDVL
ncbi:MAG: DHH family phosphoesterase [bacterium]